MKILNKYKTYILITILAILIGLYFSYPFTNGILHMGADTGFHLTRIQSYRDAILKGVKYPYMWWNANFNFGYPTPLYYCQLLLFPAVWLIARGVTLIRAYKIYIVCLMIASTFFVGLCQMKVSKAKVSTIILTMLIYLINPHQVTSIFRRSALGETMGLVFIPLALLGIYYVLYDDQNKWYVLTLGFLGLVLSHNITFILMCILFFFFILLNIKELKNKQRLLSIIKAIITTILLSLFFILPMLEGLSNNVMWINSPNNTTPIEAITLDKLFNFSCGWDVYQCSSPGPFLLFLPLCGFLIKNKKEKNKFVYHCFILSFIFLFMMTNYFPWKLFSIMNFMQFTSRILPILILLEAISGSYYFMELSNKINNKYLRYLPLTLLLIIFTIVSFSWLKTNYSGMYGYIDDDTLESAYERLYKPNEDNTYYDAQALSSGDYNHEMYLDYIHYEYTTVDNSLSHSIIDTSEEMEIDDGLINREEYYHYSFIINKNIHEKATVIAPRTYYYGYKVNVIKDDEIIDTLDTAMSKDGLVQFEVLKSDTPITYDVFYQISNIQKYSMMISKVSLILVPIYAVYDCFIKRKRAI